jgi:tetratricopeptide (TPR) repeat protein
MIRRVVAPLVLGAVAVGSSCSKPEGEEPAAAVARDTGEAARELLARVDELERAGDLEGALAQARTAIEAGGGRDATVAAAKLAIALSRHDEAIGLLEPLVAASPRDAIAQYDLGLAHHRRNDYNGARRGYLAALRADPSLADARFNLAVLCWQRGIQGEGRHHVDKFLAAFPEDPRGAELKAMLDGERSPVSAASPE